MIDAHAHYNLPPFYPDWKPYWQNAKTSGLTASVIPGTDLETSAAAMEIARQDFALYAAVGIHPHAVALNSRTKTLRRWENKLNLLVTGPKVVAVGECGLDYAWLPKDPLQATETKHLQTELLKMQIHLAKSSHKPLVLHCRDAQGDLLQILHANNTSNGTIRGVLHCFSGDEMYLNNALELGLHIGIAGNVTYQSSRELRRIAALIPDNRLLIETDMPYLPPQPYRGKPNMPEYIWKTAELVAEIRNTTLNKIINITTENARRLFKLSKNV